MKKSIWKLLLTISMVVAAVSVSKIPAMADSNGEYFYDYASMISALDSDNNTIYYENYTEEPFNWPTGVTEVDCKGKTVSFYKTDFVIPANITLTDVKFEFRTEEDLKKTLTIKGSLDAKSLSISKGVLINIEKNGFLNPGSNRNSLMDIDINIAGTIGCNGDPKEEKNYVQFENCNVTF